MAESMNIQHIAYRKIDGKDYVLVEHAERHINGMSDDALEIAALMVERWGPKTEGLAEAIRGLKSDK